MEIHQLRYLVAVAEEGNFSRAAEKVHVAQPSLSQQIQKLEAELGQPLFDRLPRSIVLTDAGRCMLDFARKILADLANAQRCVDELRSEVAGRLAVGAIPTVAPYVLPPLVRKFQKRYPKVALEIVEDMTPTIARRLGDGELDIALASTCDGSPAVERHSLGHESLLLLVPKEHSLAKNKQVKWRDLKSEKFLLLHEVNCLSQQVVQLLAANQLQPDLALKGAQLGTIAGMVAAGVGVALVPNMMVKYRPIPDCVSLPFAPPIPTRELTLLHNPMRFQSKAAEAFRQEATADFASYTTTSSR
jgi:Transcriptional regulator